jgi:hypothetical protein
MFIASYLLSAQDEAGFRDRQASVAPHTRAEPSRIDLPSSLAAPATDDSAAIATDESRQRAGDHRSTSYGCRNAREAMPAAPVSQPKLTLQCSSRVRPVSELDSAGGRSHGRS